MHWIFGKARSHSSAPVEEAARTARSTRVAAAIGLVAAVLAVGGAVGAELVDHDSTNVSSCTAGALTDYMYLYDDGVISHQEYESLRADAIDDQLNETGDC